MPQLLLVHSVSCTQKKELIRCTDKQNQELVCPLCTMLCYCPAPATKTDGQGRAWPSHSDHLCVSWDCQASFAFNSVRQPHPIPGALTPVITLFYLKRSSLFKIKGRNIDHLFSSAFLPPPERAARAHLWDPDVTGIPKFGIRYKPVAYL